MNAEAKRQYAQQIIDQGFYMKISPTLFYDVLAERLYAKHPKTGEVVRVEIKFPRNTR
jgi:hypothetical protein